MKNIVQNPKFRLGICIAVAVLGFVLFIYGLSTGSTTNGAFISGLILMIIGLVCFGLLWSVKKQNVISVYVEVPQGLGLVPVPTVDNTPLTGDEDPHNNSYINQKVDEMAKNEWRSRLRNDVFEFYMLDNIHEYYTKYKKYYLQRRDPACKIAVRLLIDHMNQIQQQQATNDWSFDDQN